MKKRRFIETCLGRFEIVTSNGSTLAVEGGYREGEDRLEDLLYYNIPSGMSDGEIKDYFKKIEAFEQ